MSRPIRDRLRDLTIDVQDLPVQPAAAVRARSRRRARRQLATAVVALAVLATTAGLAVTRAWPQQPETAAGPDVGVQCDLTLPSDPAEVRVRVVDGGASGKLTGTIAVELRNRRFIVQATPAGASDDRVAGTATLSHGPAAIGAATLVRASLVGDTTMRFDSTRRDDTVDLLVGPTFKGLATVTETNQAMVEAGEPTAPPKRIGHR